jgi:2-oxoglutarate ferredoxin oxidoreductase subunit delta
MITIDKNLCKGCNICTEFCPQKVYEKSKTLNKKGVYLPVPQNEEKCKKCNLCCLLCPDQAIKVDENNEN